MPLRIPKYAQIENFRLSIFYRLMQVGIVVPLILYFFLTEQYSMELQLKEHIFISQAVRGWANPTVLAQVAAEKASQKWCTSPNDYNYLGDFLGRQDFLSDYDFRFVGSKCAKICDSSSQKECLHPPEIWMKEGKNELLLLTSIRDTVYEADGNSSSTAFLLPFPDFLSVAFKLSYEELDKTVFRLGRTPRSATGKVFTSAEFTEPTKFEASSMCGGGVVKEIAPGSDLELSVPELFKLVCKEGYLDNIQANAGSNLLEGAKYSDGALGRIVGAEITVSVFIDADGNLATVKATMSPLSFVGGSRTEYISLNGQNTFRHRKYNGIRVRFTVDGVQTVFDVNNVILNISALVVYVSLPIIFIKFFAVYCLGHLSSIYYRVIYSKFNIAQECGATATRLMGSTCQFHQLEDVTDADGDGYHGDTGISRKVMKAYIKDVMQYRAQDLDENELQMFVELAFNEVDTGDIHKDAPQTYFGTLKAMLIDYLDIDTTAKEKKNDRDGPACINIDEFNNAFHSAFPISFDSVVKLFDKDRRQSCIERLFTPDKLKHALTKARQIEIAKRDQREKSLLRLVRSASRADDVTPVKIQPIGAVQAESERRNERREEVQSLRQSADPHVEWR